MGAQSAGQVWRGRVVRVLDDGMVWVVIPQLMGDEPLGPMPSHGATVKDARVLVVLLGGSRQDMVAVPDPDARFADVGNGLGALWDAMAGKQSAGDYVLGADPRLSDARTPKAHKHPISDVTGLDAALSGKQPAGSYATSADLATGLSGKANASHSHSVENVTGLQTALDGKAAFTHSHAVATGSMDGFMPAADKAKLDAATSGFGGVNTIALRNADGNLNANGYFARSGAAQPIFPNAMTRKDYVDGKIWSTPSLEDSTVTSAKLSAALRDLLDQYGIALAGLQSRPWQKSLGTGSINGVIEPGVYNQGSSSQVIPANGYPWDGSSGSLVISRYANGAQWIIQEWTAAADGRKAFRSSGDSGATWRPWRELTTSVVGGGSLKDTLSAPQGQVTYHWSGAAHASQSIMLVDGAEAIRNLVTNPGFESSTSGWGASRVDMSVQPQSGLLHGVGTKELLLVASGAGTAFVQTYSANRLDVSPGQWIAVSAELHGISCRAGIGIFFYSSTGTYVSEKWLVGADGERNLMSTVVPLNAAKASVGLRVYSSTLSNPAAGDSAVFDNVMAVIGTSQSTVETEVMQPFDGDTDWETSLWIDRSRTLRQWNGADWGPVG